MTPTPDQLREAARTNALRRALIGVNDWRSAADLLFLEAWLAEPAPGAAAAFRVAQLRRANPQLAAAIDAELRGRNSLPLVAASGTEPTRPA
jgi:hypothetical protein